EEENIVDIDEELKIIIIANGDHYWDASLDCSLIAMLLDPRCKSMKKLDSWERDKAIDL
ncbi:11889_t:CDS:2, partial [Racocetra persica]